MPDPFLGAARPSQLCGSTQVVQGAGVGRLLALRESAAHVLVRHPPGHALRRRFSARSGATSDCPRFSPYRSG